MQSLKEPNDIFDPPSLWDLAIPAGATLWVLNGIIWNDRFLSDKSTSQNTVDGAAPPLAAPHQWRVYRDLGLYLSAGNRHEAATGEGNIKPPSLLFLSASGSIAGPIHSGSKDDPLVRVRVTIDHIVNVTNPHPTDNQWTPSHELWLGVRDEGTLVSLRLQLPSASAHTLTLRYLTAALESARATQQQTIAKCSTTTSSLVDDTLKDLKSVQQRANALLVSIRSEYIDSEASHLETGAKRLVVADHREKLRDAMAALTDIQARRKQRATLIDKSWDADDFELGHDTPIWSTTARRDASMLSPSVTTPPPMEFPSSPRTSHSLRTRELTQRPARVETSSPSSLSYAPAPMNRKLSEIPRRVQRTRLCRHCGDALLSREEQQSHEPQCAFRTVRCRKCGSMIRAIDFRRHREKQCPRRRDGSSEGLRKTANGGNISEISSSSMEEEEDTQSDRSSKSHSGRRGTRLSEIPRADRSQWSDIPLPLTTADEKHQLLRSSSRGSMGSSSSRSLRSLPSSMQILHRKPSTVEQVVEKCPHCRRNSDAAHVARCAYRPVQCGICGLELPAKLALEHSAQHSSR